MYKRLQKCLSAWPLGDTVAVFTVLVSELWSQGVFTVLVSEPWSQGVRVFHLLECLGVSDLVFVREGNAGVLCV